MSSEPSLRFSTALIVGIAAILISGAVANATALSVVPASLKPGEPVVLSVTGLPDGSKVSIRLASSFSVEPGGDYLFGASEFVMPFSLNDATVTAKLANTEVNVLSVLKGDTEVRATGNSVNGKFTATRQMPIPQGTYDMFLAGTAAAGATRVDAGLDITGTKQGPDDGTIRFVIDGIGEEGNVSVTVLVDDVQQMSGTIQLGAPGEGNNAVNATPGVFDEENSAPNLLDEQNASQENNISPEAGLSGVYGTVPATPGPTKAGISAFVFAVCAGIAALISAWRR